MVSAMNYDEIPVFTCCVFTFVTVEHCSRDVNEDLRRTWNFRYRCDWFNDEFKTSYEKISWMLLFLLVLAQLVTTLHPGTYQLANQLGFLIIKLLFAVPTKITVLANARQY